MIDRDLPVRSNAPAREGGLLRRRSLRLAAALVLAAAVVGPACGKKGPPLAPLVKVPVVPQDVAARRAGTVAYLQFRIPEANSDNTRPADIERVEVYGFTGPAPTPADVVRYATLVTAIPVRRPLEEGDDAPRAASGKTPPPPSMANGFDQGNLLTVAETLGAAQATPMEIPRRGKQPPVFTDPWQPLLQVARKSGDARLYFAVGVNHKGQRGSFTAPQPVPLGPAPSAPLGVNASYDASGVTVSWTPPPDMPRPIQRPRRRASWRRRRAACGRWLAAITCTTRRASLRPDRCQVRAHTLLRASSRRRRWPSLSTTSCSRPRPSRIRTWSTARSGASSCGRSCRRAGR